MWRRAMLRFIMTTLFLLGLILGCTAQTIPNQEDENLGMANEEVLLEKMYKSQPDESVAQKVEINQEHLPQPVEEVVGQISDPKARITDIYEYHETGTELLYEINLKKQGKRSQFRIDEDGKMVEEVIISQKE